MKEYIVQHKLTGAEDWWEDYYQGSRDKAVLYEGEQSDEYRVVSIGEADTPEERRKELFRAFNDITDSKEAGAAIGELLLRCVNGHFNDEAFQDAIVHGHPTLQQAVFSLFIALAHRYATDSAIYIDGRNKDTQDAASKIMDALNHCTHLRMI